jgi:hypothetical protein
VAEDDTIDALALQQALPDDELNRSQGRERDRSSELLL